MPKVSASPLAEALAALDAEKPEEKARYYVEQALVLGYAIRDRRPIKGRRERKARFSLRRDARIVCALWNAEEDDPSRPVPRRETKGGEAAPRKEGVGVSLEETR